MESDEFESPAASALREFRDRVTKDAALAAPVKAALIDDLASAKPEAFERLKEAISTLSTTP